MGKQGKEVQRLILRSDSDSPFGMSAEIVTLEKVERWKETSVSLTESRVSTVQNNPPAPGSSQKARHYLAIKAQYVSDG